MSAIFPTPRGRRQTMTPEERAYLEEVRDVRESTPQIDLGDMSPYDVAWNTLSPDTRKAYLQGKAAQKGVSVGAFDWEIQRNQAMMPGLSRGSYSVSY